MDGSGKIDSYEFICGLSLLSHATLEVSPIPFSLNCYRKKLKSSSICMISTRAKILQKMKWSF